MAAVFRFWPRTLKWLFVVLVLVGALFSSVRWLLVTESGLAWLAGIVESRSGGKVTITGISRTLMHPLKADEVQVNSDGYRITLRDVYLDWQPTALLSGRLDIFSLTIRDAEVRLLESNGSNNPPENQQIPVSLNVLKLEVDRLAIYKQDNALPEFFAEDIEARLANDAELLQLKYLHARLNVGVVTGKGTMGLVRPFPVHAEATLQATLDLNARQEPATIHALADGSLAALKIQLDGRVAGVAVDGRMQLEPFVPVPLASVSIGFSGANPSTLYNSAPVAEISGKFDLKGVSNETLEGTLQLYNKTTAPLDQGGLPIEKITSQISVSAEELKLTQLVATISGAGSISGFVSWLPRSEDFSGALRVSELKASALHGAFPDSRLGGEITFDGQSLQQRAKLSLSDGTFILQAVANRHGAQLELSEVRLQRGKASFTGQGQLTLDQHDTFSATGQFSHLDLGDYEPRISTDISGKFVAEGSLHPEPTGELTLDIAEQKLFAHALRSKVKVAVAGLNAVRAEARIALLDNYADLTLQQVNHQGKFNMQLDASDLAQLAEGLAGQLSGSLDAEGTLKSPQLRFRLEGAGLQFPGEYHVAELEALGELRDDQITAKLDMNGLAGPGELSIPATAVAISGNMARQNLDASASLAQGNNMVGKLTMSASGGFINSEDAWQERKWRGAIGKLEAQGLLPFTLREPAPLVLSGQAMYVGDARLDFKSGEATLDDLLWTPHMMHSAGRFVGINVRIVNQAQVDEIAAPLRAMRFAGSWDITSSEHLNGNVRLRRERNDIEGATDGGNPGGIDAIDLSLLAESDRLRGDLIVNSELPGKLTAHANVPITPGSAGWTIQRDAPLTGKINVKSGNLSWLAPLVDKNLASAGKIAADLDLEGTVSVPRLRGAVEGDGLSISLLDQGIRLEDGQLRARFEGNTLRLDRLHFVAPHSASPRDALFGDYKLAAGTGELGATGKIDLDGDNSKLLITAQHVPLFQRSDRWIIASGKGQARYASKALHLDGNIRADAGLINQPVSDRPRLSDDVQIVGATGSSRTQMPYSILGTLDMGEHFHIRASGLEARLAGNLDVRKETEEPVSVTGIIAAQNAVFEAYGQRLQVERGFVNFQGKLDDPGLNLLALRKGLSVEAGVEVTGTVRRPEVRLVSTPNVPDGEKLSWIMLGRVPESSGVDNSLLIAAANNILGGQTAGQFSRALGVDEISISQQAGTDSALSQKVTVGKRLSTRASISYEKGLNETGGVTRFTYTLTPRITIVTRSGTEDALDVFYSFRFY
jgi:translocation and assembly module TamB